MFPTIPWMKENFAEFNNRYFGGGLPIPQFVVRRMTDEWGRFDIDVDYDRNRRITNAKGNGILTINSAYSRSENSLLTTLLHEMCHMYVYLVMRVLPRNAHGREFMSIAQKINADGWNVQPETDASDTDVFDEDGQQNANTKVIICILHATNNQHYEYWICKVNEDNINEFKSTISRNPAAGQAAFFSANIPSLANAPSNPQTLAGWGGQSYMEVAKKVADYCGADYRLLLDKNLTRIG